MFAPDDLEMRDSVVVHNWPVSHAISNIDSFIIYVLEFEQMGHCWAMVLA